MICDCMVQATYIRNAITLSRSLVWGRLCSLGCTVLYVPCWHFLWLLGKVTAQYTVVHSSLSPFLSFALCSLLYSVYAF